MWANFIFIVFILNVFLSTPVFSEEATTDNQIPAGSCCVSFENEKIKYFKENRYSEYMDFLDKYKTTNKFDKTCVNYYKALARYNQLGYLEEKQSWDDYFANGNTYRDHIVENTNEVISKAPKDSCLGVKTRLLAWQFHRGQQDAFYEQALTDLMTQVKAYAQTSKDAPLIRQVADALLINDQKSEARELYKLYVNKLAQDKMTDPELKIIAAGFYKEKNMELAQTVYDIYIERAHNSLAPDKFVVELFEIASLFVYKPQGLYDMAYAEKIYALIEAQGQKNVFNQEQIYLRAFNLEKMKEYKQAREFYLQLVQLFVDSKHFDEATYKIAMIDAYVLAEIKEAKSLFEQLSLRSFVTPQVISSFYQLGLLSQWEGDLTKAKDYYNTLVEKSKDAHRLTVALASERLNEIQQNKPISYNLKTFLDLSFKDGSSFLEMGRSELTASGYILGNDQKVAVSSLMNMPESGCNQVELQYLWSGNLGQATPSASDPGFECAYSDLGTKEINLVVVTPSGTLDRSFIMVDVY